MTVLQKNKENKYMGSDLGSITVESKSSRLAGLQTWIKIKLCMYILIIE
jgi:hypothetical protein